MRPLPIALLLALTASPVAALSVRTSVRLVAWSSDGESALLLKQLDGPEGGGQLSYHLVSRTAPTQLSLVISSDMSPGGGERTSWQTISRAECEKRVAQLGRALAAKHFGGIAARPAGCRGDRKTVLSIDPEVLKEALATAISPASLDEPTQRHRRGKVDLTFGPAGGELVDGSSKTSFSFKE